MSRYHYSGLIGIALFVVTGCGDPQHQLKGEYMKSCTQSGAPVALCECAWNKISQTYPPDVLLRIYNGESVPPDFFKNSLRFTQACIQASLSS